MRSKLAVCLTVIVLLSTLAAGCSKGGGGGLSVPVNIENADQLGVIAFSFLYDSAVLEIAGVGVGKMATPSKAQYNKDTPGRVFVVIENATISGDGTLVKVKCNVLDAAGSSKLAVQVLEARSADTGEVLETQVSEGSFSASDMSVQAPVISFGE